jgi:hypothetical protein
MTMRIDGALVPVAPETPPPVASAEPAPAQPEGPSPFARFLTSLGQSVDQGEGMMEGVASGQAVGVDPGTLIALQAGIYRYSEAVDLAGKLIDRGGNAVRTVLHGGQ